jgi:hypothetical protein
MLLDQVRSWRILAAHLQHCTRYRLRRQLVAFGLSGNVAHGLYQVRVKRGAALLLGFLRCF